MRFNLIVASVVLSCFIGVRDSIADNPSCGSNYWVVVSCDGLTFQSQNIHGDATGATNSGAICFAAYWADQTEPSYYVKYIQISSCDTSLGYVSTPHRDVHSVCIGNPNNVVNTFSSFYCECNADGYGTWTDVSGANYQQAEYRNCPNATTMRYRCKAGYYATGTTPNTSVSALGCVRCGTIDDIQTSSPVGSDSCKACCAPANSEGHDTMGGYTLQDDCCFVSC